MARGLHGSPVLHLMTKDVDQRFSVMRDCDKVVIKPEDELLGTRRMAVANPDGNLIAFHAPQEL